MAKIVTYSEARNNFKKYLDYTTDNHEAIFITRKNAQEVVLMSKADYEAMNETSYLLSSQANRKNLLDTIQDIEAGNNKDSITFKSTKELREYFEQD